MELIFEPGRRLDHEEVRRAKNPKREKHEGSEFDFATFVLRVLRRLRAFVVQLLLTNRYSFTAFSLISPTPPLTLTSARFSAVA